MMEAKAGSRRWDGMGRKDKSNAYCRKQNQELRSLCRYSSRSGVLFQWGERGLENLS